MKQDYQQHPYIRCKILLESKEQINQFILALCDGTNSWYAVENKEGDRVVNARSMLGMMYATAEFDETYLVNETNNGHFSSKIDAFRKP